ncbi:hypothetical protein [Rhodoferax mekongensis]|uniref:hypothetical protein n=1 Tax=Rhodoferax mekongensis TaxID=3068341 RepID=UPI0028BDD134|nr:hypothetical protein [Rhodoferax sp. TBRC 17199]MDT7514696.1 hypothetical protein [Rhodoferax sp. TBRC 17199]
MVSSSKQNWTVGNTVKVGFLFLVVKAAIATPGDYLPDAYILANTKGTQLYKFVPHKGLEKIDAIEARELIATSKTQADRIASRAIAKAQQDAAAIAEINELIFS